MPETDSDIEYGVLVIAVAVIVSSATLTVLAVVWSWW
jgi:hypothetical protein